MTGDSSTVINGWTFVFDNDDWLSPWINCMKDNLPVSMFGVEVLMLDDKQETEEEELRSKIVKELDLSDEQVSQLFKWIRLYKPIIV